jgi:deoxyribonuclease IV
MNIQDFKIGCHVSISGSKSKSFANAEKIGCSAFQIFSRNPRNWQAKDLSKDEIEKFVKKKTQVKLIKII